MSVTPSSTPFRVTTSSPIVTNAINSCNLSDIEKHHATRSLYTVMIIFFIEYSSLVSGVGAILYSIVSALSIDISSIITNKTGTMIINGVIFVSGLITVLEWLFEDIMLTVLTNSYNK
jgi:hypothetical protein